MTDTFPSRPLTLYGRADCDDTQRTRGRLLALGVPFREVSIDHDAAADAFVRFINGGSRSTPTLVFGTGRRKVVLTEPEDEELERELSRGAPAGE